jgi:flagellar basal-body rod protein FlgB
MSAIDDYIGLHAHALNVRAKRSEVLASNLANADTPGYKARDVDFKTLLNQYESGQAGTMMKTTHSRHLPVGENGNIAGETMYRTPNQSSIDGNTVDTQLEKAEYLQNAMQYQTTLTFLNSKIGTLRKAIRGD